MTRTEFIKLVTAAGSDDRGQAVGAQDALIDWWRDEAEQMVEDARDLEDALDAQDAAEERAIELENARDTAIYALHELEASVVEMICSVCLHDIRHAPVCVGCAPRLAARA